MKFLSNRTRLRRGFFLIIMCIAIAGIIVVFAVDEPQNSGSQKVLVSGIVVGTRKSITEQLNVHASGQKYVILWGHKYFGLRGEYPYFLQTPSGKMLFVLENQTARVMIIVADPATKIVREINAQGIGIGYEFGVSSNPIADWSEWIESEDSSKIITRKNAGSNRTRIVIDLITGVASPIPMPDPG